MTLRFSRRSALRTIAGSSAAAMAAGILSTDLLAEEKAVKLKGNINHSACRWCYGKIELEELCKAAAGIPSVICMSGNREGMDDAEGLANCAKGVKRLMKLAEEQKVNVVMELLNSKVDHKDYMCDHTAWGAELCRQVGSPRFGLLYDIYHMQIMEGDIIATIRANAEYIFHYHTGGVPGRNEIDETQEIYYPAVMKAIVETGFKGYVAQEFIPKSGDPLASLRRSVEICDV